MLEELGKDLVNVAMVGVGAIAIAAEKMCELGKVCAEKGADTLEKGKTLNEELRQKGEQIAQERRERCRQEALERLTAEEREELRRKLAELDLREAAAKRAAEEAEQAEKAEASKVVNINPESHEGDEE